MILQLEYLSTSGNGTGKFQAANTSPSGLLFKHETWFVSKKLKIPHTSYVIRGSLNKIFRTCSKKKDQKSHPAISVTVISMCLFFRLSQKNHLTAEIQVMQFWNLGLHGGGGINGSPSVANTQPGLKEDQIGRLKIPRILQPVFY